MTFRWMLMFIFALILGYGTEWSPYYVALFYGDNVRILGSIDQFKTPCVDTKTPQSYCTNKYNIPQNLIEPFKDTGTLGTGIILSATTYSCINSQNNEQVQFDDPNSPGRLFDLFNRYQSVDLKQLSCTKGIEVKAWSRYGARRTGHVGGIAAVGSNRALERIKRLTEFFTIDLLMLYGFLFIALFTISTTMSRLIEAKIQYNPFEDQLWLWLTYLLFVSGIEQILIPYTEIPQITNKVAAFLSLICHAGPILAHIKRQTLLDPIKDNLRLWTLSLLSRNASLLLYVSCGLLMSTKYFVTFFGPTFTLLGTATLGLAIYTSDRLLIFYSLSYIITGLKILNLPYFPHPQVATYFVGMVISYDLVIRFKQGAKLVKLLSWPRKWVATEKNLDRPDPLIEAFRLIEAGRLSLLTLRPGGGCKITVYSENSSGIKAESFEREELPAIFAHVISSRETLWHLDAQSTLMTSIRRGHKSSSEYTGNYLSVVPLLGETYPVGAISFTDYPSEWINDAAKNSELRTMLRILQPLLIEQILSNELIYRNELLEKIGQIQQEIAKKKITYSGNQESEITEKATFQWLIERVCFGLNAFGYIAELDETSREFHIHGIHGYPREVRERLTMGRLFALKENMQGPLALAINNERPVIISDVRLLRSVLHENTNLFFERSGTKSCAAVPLFTQSKSKGGNENKRHIWGVMFLERNTTEPFTLQFTKAFELISDAIEDLLKTIGQTIDLNRTQKALASFVPKRVLSRIVNSSLEREEDHGILLMIDLKDSTSISFEVGSEAWLENVKALEPIVEKSAEKHGLSLQFTQWDAFFFTHSGGLPSPEEMSRFNEFIVEVFPKIDEWYSRNYGKLNPKKYAETSSQKARACLTFGDISRGFSGTPRSWSIVGTEISAMKKLEDVCKGLKGVIFADSSLVESLKEQVWTNTGAKVPHTNRTIYSTVDTWEQLVNQKKVVQNAG